MELLALALRNLTRNKRRTVLTMIIIFLGAFLLLIAQGFFRGFIGGVYSNIVNIDTSHIQIENKNYRDEMRRLPLDYLVNNSKEVMEEAKSMPNFLAASQRVDFSLELTNGTDALRGLMGRGVSAEAEKTISQVSEKISEGRWLRDGDSGLVIGSGIAKKLGLKIGSEVNILAYDVNSVKNFDRVQIIGIIHTDYPLFDERTVYMDLPNAQNFLSLGNTVSRIVIKTSDLNSVNDSLAALSKSIAIHSDLVAHSWRTIAESSISFVEARLKIFSMVLFILFVLIIIGIVNSMTMTVLERYKEIGTLRAIGMKGKDVMKVFILEGMIQGAIAAFIGVLIGTIPDLILQNVGISLKGILPADTPIPYGDAIRGQIQITDYFLAFGVGVFASILGSFIPARRARKLSVLEALGTAR